jgi:hypothetical protein
MSACLAPNERIRARIIWMRGRVTSEEAIGGKLCLRRGQIQQAMTLSGECSINGVAQGLTGQEANELLSRAVPKALDNHLTQKRAA